MSSPPPLLSALDSRLSTRRRFVILIHDHPFVHWDLLLEDHETAPTWRLLECPDRWLLNRTSRSLPAEAIAAHRLAYLDYEGPVSRERGTVARWDCGTFQWLEQTAQLIHVLLSGENLQGELSLRNQLGLPWSADFRPAHACPASGLAPEVPALCS